MDISGIIQILQTIVTSLPGAITTAKQLYDLGAKLYETANGKAPSAAEQAQLESQIDSDVMEALTPLPPAQPGDPDFTG